MTTEQTLISAITELRDPVLGLTQSEFANVLGTSYSTVQGYSGARLPPPKILAKLCFLAREAKRPDLAELFKQAAIRELDEQLVRLIREGSGSQASNEVQPANPDEQAVLLWMRSTGEPTDDGFKQHVIGWAKGKLLTRSSSKRK